MIRWNKNTEKIVVDKGHKVECDHKYTKCYKAWVGCYTSQSEKVNHYFRGCGGIATVGEH